jgi:hypothetical protein
LDFLVFNSFCCSHAILKEICVVKLVKLRTFTAPGTACPGDAAELAIDHRCGLWSQS